MRSCQERIELTLPLFIEGGDTLRSQFPDLLPG